MHFGAESDVKRVLDNPAVPLLVVLALMVVGAILRLFVAGQDLFADELATYWIVSTRGIGGVVETVSTTAEITPPLGFMLSWLTSRFGLSPELVRLPAIVAGIGAIPLVYAVGIRTVGRDAALLAATMTTLSPFMIFYSAEARGYGVLMTLVLLSTLALLLAVEDGRLRWWVAYGAFVCLAAYTHYTAVFVLAAQLGWALWAHPRARRPLLIATSAAAILYLPWLPSLKGDVESPTTEILSFLSPFDVESVRLSLGHWSVGYPYSFPKTSLTDVPGVPALLLLAVSLCVGAYGIFTMRSQLGQWFADRGGHLGLVVLLALATPVGAALQSTVGTNVFSTRSLASSWPYLALAVAALITVGRPALRLTAAALAVVALGLSTSKMSNPDVQRPEYAELAQFVRELPRGVVVDGAAFTPGPLTNLDVEESSPGVEVFRLNVPEQMTRPFGLEPQPDPADLARRVAVAADGGPITVISFAPPTPIVEEFIDLLPDGYELSRRELTRGLFAMQALVYERPSAAG